MWLATRCARAPEQGANVAADASRDIEVRRRQQRFDPLTQHAAHGLRAPRSTQPLLRLNLHLHVLWLDGAYGWEPGRGKPEFHAQRELNDGDVQQLVRRILDRVLRALRKAGSGWTRMLRWKMAMPWATSCCSGSLPRRSKGARRSANELGR